MTRRSSAFTQHKRSTQETSIALSFEEREVLRLVPELSALGECNFSISNSGDNTWLKVKLSMAEQEMMFLMVTGAPMCPTSAPLEHSESIF